MDYTASWDSGHGVGEGGENLAATGGYYRKVDWRRKHKVLNGYGKSDHHGLLYLMT
jgi:hypothetical protein